MSASAIRFAPRTRAQSGIRTGGLAYQGIMAQIMAEREEAARAEAEHHSFLESLAPIVVAHAATYDYQTKDYRRHYADGVQVIRATRGHIALRASYR